MGAGLSGAGFLHYAGQGCLYLVPHGMLLWIDMAGYQLPGVILSLMIPCVCHSLSSG